MASVSCNTQDECSALYIGLTTDEPERYRAAVLSLLRNGAKCPVTLEQIKTRSYLYSPEYMAELEAALTPMVAAVPAGVEDGKQT